MRAKSVTHAIDRPLRIAFVAYRGNMQCGGQGIYLWFLARELARLGHEIDIYVGPPYPDPMPFAQRLFHLPNEMYWAKWFLGNRQSFIAPGDPWRALRPLHFYELAASRIGFLPEPFAFSLRALHAMAKELRAKKRYDIVHDVQCLGYGLLPLRQMKMPLVATVHHPLTVDRRASFQRDQSLKEAIGTMQFYPIGMQSFVARRMDRIFTSSMASAAMIEQDFGVQHKRLVHVANGIDTEIFSPDPTVPRQENTLLCVARANDPNKGVRTLIQALALLDPKVKLILVDVTNSEAARWAQQYGCKERLQITGRVSVAELVQLYRSASLVVVPSSFEGFGLPAVEAMACGTPVVSTRSGALAEVMASCQGGETVPPTNPQAMAEAIRALLAAPGRRHDLGSHARKRVVDTYAWDRIAQRTCEEYQTLIR